MRRAFVLRLLAATAFLALNWAAAAPTTTTITATPTPGPGGLGTTVMAPSGGTGVYNITGGTTAGSNLFHSFSTFNLGNGDTADFNVTSGISNILARVTGGPSTIDGRITSTNETTGMPSTANLFFINPAGVMFTSNAQVNLGGSFVVSTANYVMLNHGSIFYADVNHPTEDGGLTTAAVSAFGFLAGTTPMPISISDGAQFTIGGSLQFVGGDFTAGANTLSVTSNSSVVGIFSGAQVNGTTDASVPYISSGNASDYSGAANFNTYGNVTLGDAAGATVSANGSGGSVVIRGGRLMQQGTGGMISTTTGAIGISATRNITMTGGTITSQGGPITITQASMNPVTLSLDSASSITETAGSGQLLSINSTGTINNGGSISTVGSTNPIQINAVALNLTTGSGVSGSITASGGAVALGTSGSPLGGLSLANGTSVTNTGAGTLTINCSGLISNSGTLSTGTGTLSVDTTGDLTLTGGSIASAGGVITLGQTSLDNLSLNSTSTINSVGGPVTVIARGDIDLTGGSIESTNSGNGNAGSVNVTDNSGNITLSAGSEIASIASGAGSAGNVNINYNSFATDLTKTLTITGTGVATPNTGIFSMSNGTGNAGTVNVTAPGNVVLSSGGQIASVATNTSGGTAGSVTLNLNAIGSTLTVGGLSANATAASPIIYSSTANAAQTDGAVSVNALLSTVVLQPGASIQTSSQDTVAGDVFVDASSLTLDANSAIQSVMSQASSDGSKKGKTGDVEVLVLDPFEFNAVTLSFNGPLSIADSAFIQTEAFPTKMGFNPLGQVTIYAGSLTEGGVPAALATGTNDFAYKIQGHTNIREFNAPSLNAANGADAVSGPGPIVEDLSGFPNEPNGTTPPTPPAGMGIMLDNTLDGALGDTAIMPVLNGSTYDYNIYPIDGTTAGDNLFLSFSEFNLGINHPNPQNTSQTGSVSEAAVFNAPGYDNILVRVTGGPSQIDGELEEAMGTTANLYFLNSSGIMFTANSSLNLNGALTISTANDVQFGTFPSGITGTFVAQGNDPAADQVLKSNPSLFTGPVADFGFSGTTPAPVQIETASLTNDSPTNGLIQVVAGDITISDGALVNASNTMLFSAGGMGTLGFAPSATLPTVNFNTLGTITIEGGSVLTAPNPNFAATFSIFANNFNLDDSLIVDQTTASSGSLAGSVLVDVTGTAKISSTNNPSFISTSTLGTVDGGSVQINAANLTIMGSSNLPFATGIFSTAEPVNYYTSDSGYIAFGYGTTPTATGNAGSINVNVSGQVNLSQRGQISTDTNGFGRAGTITIAGLNSVNPQITIGSGSSITSSTSLQDNTPFSSTGAAGTVRLTASSLSVTGVTNGNPSLIATSAGTLLNPAGPTGNGGNIFLTVTGQTGAGNGDISITNGGQVSASSYNNGEGGTVTVDQSNDMDGTTIDGMGASTPTGIFAAEFGTGNSSGINAFAIKLNTDSRLTLQGGGEISTSAAGNGSAGPIQVTSGTVLIDGTGADPSQATGILSSSTGTASTGSSSTGNGGNVTLNVTGDLDLTNSGTIAASSQTVGAAGRVTITQSGSTDITDPTLNPATNGGIDIDGGSISTAADGTGSVFSVNAGIIRINTQALTLNGAASNITSSTTGLSKAGNITINGISGPSTQFVVVEGGAAIASNTAGSGNGGTISINSATLTVEGSGSTISTNATAGTGNGGSINLTVTGNPSTAGLTGDVILTNGGAISASSQTTGAAGTVTITQSGSTDITDPTMNPATNGGIFINGGTISTAADGPGANPSTPGAGDITLNTEALTVTGSTSEINSSTSGLSNAGQIVVNGVLGQPTQFVMVQNGATVMSESTGTGSAGMVTIHATKMMVTGTGSTISTDAGALGSTTDSKGEIMLTGDELLVTQSGLISATTGGLSPGGTITATISSEVALSFDGKLDASSTAPTGGGNGGSIMIGSNPVGSPEDYGTNSPYALDLSYGSIISCDSQNTNGGNITIHADDVNVESGSLLSTNEPNGGSTTLGGNITIRAGYSFYLDDSSFIDTNDGQGTGGNITIDPEFTILDHSNINAAGGLMYGNVLIDSTYVFSDTSFITATGTVEIDSVPLDLTGSLRALPASLTDEQKRLREKCARAVNHEFSSLIVVGRGGTETGPDELQPDYGADVLPEAAK